MRHHQLPRADAFTIELPRAVRQLAPRERQVAALIYRKGALTAKEVGAHVTGVSNGSIRTMLGRLVRKGILKCRHSGYGKTLLYLPATASADIVEIALKRVAEDFYQGSVFEAANAIQAFLAARQGLRGQGAR
jgi:predicted transcriptional regulator